MAILKIDSLCKEYRLGAWSKPVSALKNLTLNVEKGEIFGFLGPNGAGKTTTIKILMGLLYPTSGTAWIAGKNIIDKDVHEDVGFLPENPYIYKFLTGVEFLDFCGRLHCIPRKKRKARAYELLELVGLDKALEKRVGAYSKGMQQRLGLAQALISDPEILFLDEPFSGLDPIGRKEMSDLVIDLKKAGKTIFFCSHILADVEILCDRVAILNKGKLIQLGTVSEIVDKTIKSYDIQIVNVEQDLLLSLRKKYEGITMIGDVVCISVKTQEEIMQVVQEVSKSKSSIRNIIPRQETLEDFFVRTMGSGDVVVEDAV